MRLWQYYAVEELTKYGMPIIDIAANTGLTTVAVADIQNGSFIPDTIMFHVDGDTLRCPTCGSTVLSPCFYCYSAKVGPEHSTEVLERPSSHQNYMLNVHLLKPEEQVE